jgi:hypothetical protein
LSLDGSEWSASYPGRFISGERYLINHWTGYWVGPGSDLYAFEKRKRYVKTDDLKSSSRSQYLAGEG